MKAGHGHRHHSSLELTESLHCESQWCGCNQKGVHRVHCVHKFTSNTESVLCSQRCQGHSLNIGISQRGFLYTLWNLAERIFIHFIVNSQNGILYTLLRSHRGFLYTLLWYQIEVFSTLYLGLKEKILYTLLLSQREHSNTLYCNLTEDFHAHLFWF